MTQSAPEIHGLVLLRVVGSQRHRNQPGSASWRLAEVRLKLALSQKPARKRSPQDVNLRGANLCERPKVVIVTLQFMVSSSVIMFRNMNGEVL